MENKEQIEVLERKAVLVGPEECGRGNTIRMICPVTVKSFGEDLKALMVISGSEDDFRLRNGEPEVVRETGNPEIFWKDCHDWHGRWRYDRVLKEYQGAGGRAW